jgi:polyhydroxybutyrate depolymerase
METFERLMQTLGARVWGPQMVLLLAVACASGERASSGQSRWLAAGDHRFDLTFADRERYFLVRVPPLPAPDAGYAVLLAYHGGGGNPESFKNYSGLDRVADREGFLVVYPAGTGPLLSRLLTWNAGLCCGYAQDQGVDDAGFSVALLEALAGRIPLDATRVYSTGHSNGAMMAYRMAVQESGRIAAIAPVAGAMMVSAPSEGPPVPILHIHSVDDPRALYRGGLGPPFPLTRRRVEHPPLEKTLAYWIERNGCSPTPVIVERRRGSRGTRWASHTAERLVWEAAPDGAPLEHWRLHGPGHGWPGGDRSPVDGLIGPWTGVISAAEEIWAFLSRFRRPNAPPPGRAAGAERSWTPSNG